MILPFSDKFPNGNRTYFEEKLNIIGEKCIISNFVPKIHTIRKDLSGRWKKGNSVQGYYHSRTKRMRKIFDGACIYVQAIEINYEPNYCEQMGSYPVVLVQYKDVDHLII